MSNRRCAITVTQQRDIQMTFEVLAAEGNLGAARWRTNFTPVSSGEPLRYRRARGDDARPTGIRKETKS